jgi:hypothetical protein
MKSSFIEILSKTCKEHDCFFYLASPYTGAEAANYDEVLVYSWILHQKGIYHFCPIAACHVIAKRYGLPTDYIYWKGFNESFLQPSAGIIIANMGNWRNSKGIAYEIERALALNKPVYLATKELTDPPGITLHILHRRT